MFLAKTKIPRGHTGHSYWADKIHDWQICNIGTGKMNYNWNWESGDTAFVFRWLSAMTLQLLKIQYHMGFSENRLLQNSSKSHSSSSFPIKFPISNSWAIPCFQTHLQNQSQSSLIAKGSPKCLDPAQISHVSAGLTCHWCICRKKGFRKRLVRTWKPKEWSTWVLFWRSQFSGSMDYYWASLQFFMFQTYGFTKKRPLGQHIVLPIDMVQFRNTLFLDKAMHC